MGRRPIEGIVLAGGSSKRMGLVKQLLPIGGRPMLMMILEAALSSDLDGLTVVLGANAEVIQEAIEPILNNNRSRIVLNRDFREGMASSIRTGIRSLPPETQSVMFILGDQPLLDTRTINRLIHCFLESDKDICVPVVKGMRGNPVTFGRSFFHELLGLRGDVGGRAVLERHPSEILEVELESPEIFQDVDNIDDLKAVNKIIASTKPSNYGGRQWG